MPVRFAVPPGDDEPARGCRRHPAQGPPRRAGARRIWMADNQATARLTSPTRTPLASGNADVFVKPAPGPPHVDRVRSRAVVFRWIDQPEPLRVGAGPAPARAGRSFPRITIPAPGTPGATLSMEFSRECCPAAPPGPTWRGNRAEHAGAAGPLP